MFFLITCLSNKNVCKIFYFIMKALVLRRDMIPTKVLLLSLKPRGRSTRYENKAQMNCKFIQILLIQCTNSQKIKLQ